MSTALREQTLVTRIDRYIIAKFLGTYFFSILLIISIAVVLDFNENIDKFITKQAPWKAIIFDYYMNFVPYFANLFSPLFIFIAVIFFTSKLADNSEIIAMMSTGMSFRRLMRPYMIAAAMLSIMTFYLGSYIIPQGGEKRVNFENRYKQHRTPPTYVENAQLEVDTGVIAYIERYENTEKTGYHFSLDKFVNKKLVAHLTAQRIVYDTLADERCHWKIYDYTIRELKGMREFINRGMKMDSVIDMEPQDLLVIKNQQQTMTNPQLSEYIEKQRKRGFANIKQFEVEYHKRFAMSFASFILTTIGVALSSKKRKGGMGLPLGIGLGLSFSYILFQTISSTFAINANMPPIIAAWIPNFIYAIIAFVMYKKAPQ